MHFIDKWVNLYVLILSLIKSGNYIIDLDILY